MPSPSPSISISPAVSIAGRGDEQSSPAFSPLIKIASDKATQAEHKKWQGQMQRLSESHDKHGNIASKRHERMFVGGPWDGHITESFGNGPRMKTDPKGRHADYFIKDKMFIPEAGRKITGYHIYSNSRSIWADDNGYVRPEHRQFTNVGLRGPQMRMMFYYAGFLDEGFLSLGGLDFSEFSGILKA